jgi:hypothetical protein
MKARSSPKARRRRTRGVATGPAKAPPARPSRISAEKLGRSKTAAPSTRTAKKPARPLRGDRKSATEKRPSRRVGGETELGIDDPGDVIVAPHLPLP